MNKLTMTLVAAMSIAMTSCQKDEITPSNPDLKTKPIECRKCVEGWDITEPVPPTNP